MFVCLGFHGVVPSASETGEPYKQETIFCSDFHDGNEIQHRIISLPFNMAEIFAGSPSAGISLMQPRPLLAFTLSNDAYDPTGNVLMCMRSVEAVARTLQGLARSSEANSSSHIPSLSQHQLLLFRSAASAETQHHAQCKRENRK